MKSLKSIKHNWDEYVFWGWGGWNEERPVVDFVLVWGWGAGKGCTAGRWWGWGGWWVVINCWYELLLDCYNVVIWDWWCTESGNWWDSCFWNMYAKWGYGANGCIWGSWWWDKYWWWNWCIGWTGKTSRWWWGGGAWQNGWTDSNRRKGWDWLCTDISGDCCWYWWGWSGGCCTSTNCTWWQWWGWQWGKCWCSATYYGWGWGGSCSSTRWWCWYQWVFIVRYPNNCGYDICWGNKYECNWYCVHCFESNGTLTIN